MVELLRTANVSVDRVAGNDAINLCIHVTNKGSNGASVMILRINSNSLLLASVVITMDGFNNDVMAPPNFSSRT
jgi:hypothetical protein